ncbi:MAG: hypothetical protein HMLKMBBP_02237 [Planctomycetes bacterium]|nr:hypothetical protein [Planctomycetota bacterium]
MPPRVLPIVAATATAAVLAMIVTAAVPAVRSPAPRDAPPQTLPDLVAAPEGPWLPPPAAPLPDLPSLRGGTERVGAHFRVVSLPGGADCSAEALAAAESVWPLCRAWFGAPDSVREKPTVWIHWSEASYHEVERALTGGRLARNLAFAHLATRSAHVVLQARIPDEARSAIGLHEVTRRLVAHESVHLARYVTSPNAGKHPQWLADGLALCISDEACRAAGWSVAFAECAVTSTRIAAAQKEARAGELPDFTELLSGETADLGFQSRYGARHLAARMLFDGRTGETVRAYLRARFAEPDGPHWRALFDAGLSDLLTVRTLAAAHSEFPRWVLRFEPRWDDPGLSLDTGRAGRWIQWAGAAGRTAWRIHPARIVTVAGEAEFLSGAECALRFGSPGRPVVTVPLRRPAGAATTRFRVTLDGSRLRATVDGAQTVDVPFDGPASAVGLTAPPECLLAWNGVEFSASAR